MNEALATLRMLQLPHRASAEGACSAALAAELSASGLQADDWTAWAEFEILRWEENGEPSALLNNAAVAIGRSAATNESSVVAPAFSRLVGRYFSVHGALVQDHGLSFPQATSLLSHAAAIIRLAIEDRHSSAQIARILAPKDQRACFSRQVVAELLKAAGCEPRLSQEEVEDLFNDDRSQEIDAFADADLKGAIAVTCAVAARFGVADAIGEALSVLGPQERNGRLESNWTPYLQILHYQCSVTEFFDHSVLDLYEFSPRGAAATWLFNQYPHSISGAQNPFLNNAKAVEVLTESWVRSKKVAERRGARSVFTILSTLDSLGFAARRELCRWLRLWLHRIIRRAQETPLLLPGFLTVGQIRALASAVVRGNTGTFGIIEQRVVDCVAYGRHRDWRARGVGDSVHATNLSGRKFGDCEFIDVARRTIEAYEAHGGVLSQLYVQQHLLTLARSIPRRLDELRSYDDVGNWQLRIHFIAHDVGATYVGRENVHGLSVEVIPVSFREFLEDLSQDEDESRLVGVFQDLFLSPMRDQRTPNLVRAKFVELIGSSDF